MTFNDLVLSSPGLPCETAPEVFFPDDQQYVQEAISYAKLLCDRCDIRIQCLTYALESREIYGIWGQTTPAERKRILAF
jgi:WhiB family redox-sensing transcriptional regulator